MQTELGVIEGFYGRIYSKEQRESLCEFLGCSGYGYYIYAPKNDRSLRSSWETPFTEDKIQELKAMSEHCSRHSLKFGIGISPLKLTENYEEKFSLLVSKIDTLINRVGIGIIAILFDDIRLYTSDEGRMQNRIVREIFNKFNHNEKRNLRIIFCPTYYSFDPILEKLFGARPENYFADLMQGLDKSIEVFWTGNRVLSKEISRADIENINSLLGRKVTVWDNYPVNDGRKISTYIYTREFERRCGLDGTVLSHAVNPMLEAELSKAALATLPLVYANCSKEDIAAKREQTISALFPEQTGKFRHYLEILNSEGLAGLDDQSEKELRMLCEKYCTKVRACRELLDFLNGVYKFDEACLTS